MSSPDLPPDMIATRTDVMPITDEVMGLFTDWVDNPESDWTPPTAHAKLAILATASFLPHDQLRELHIASAQSILGISPAELALRETGIASLLGKHIQATPEYQESKLAFFLPHIGNGLVLGALNEQARRRDKIITQISHPSMPYRQDTVQVMRRLLGIHDKFPHMLVQASHKLAPEVTTMDIMAGAMTALASMDAHFDALRRTN